jgi:hypothetical protein
MDVTHPFVVGIADQADATEVRPSNWNAAHKVLVLSADPVSPVQGQVWILLTGTSPTRVASLKFRDGGVTYTLVSVTN